MQAQNFLICLEMLFSAVAHCFIFSPDEWAPGYREREEARRKNYQETAGFGDSVAFGDFINDIKLVMASKAMRKRRKKRMREERRAMMSSPPNSSKSREEIDDDADNDEDEEAGGLELPRPSFDNESQTDIQFNTTFDSCDSLDLGGGTGLHDDQNAVRLADAPTSMMAQGNIRQRLDTGSSAGSDDGAVRGSWSRIETYLEKHASPRNQDNREIV
jgi:hypothetical protein